ncbi:hypothetical protein D3C85_1824740 [compost metagenome]
MILSTVAPVSALMGLMQRLPQSLYQTSFWIWLDACVSIPAELNRSTRLRTRLVYPPEGSPRMSLFPLT